MRRWIILALLLLLPFQASWSAVAAYCQHEADATVVHFGHHEHQHGHGEQMTADGDGPSDPLGYHADCHTCHGHGAAALSMPSAVAEYGGGSATIRYQAGFTSRSLEPLFRPPLAALA